MKQIWAVVPLLLLVGGTIGCDRVTKHVAATTLAGSPGQSFLGDTVRLEYTENTGAFLGLGADWPSSLRVGLFTIGNALLLLLVVAAGASRQWSRPARIGLALLLAGGASNLVDRTVQGSVIDFMNVGLGPLRTGIFNVADVAILAGVGLVLLSSYRSRDQRHLIT